MITEWFHRVFTGTTPLHKAARKGDGEAVAAILSRGANPNAKDKEGRTPLHWAADAGVPDEVKKRFKAAKKGRSVSDSSTRPSDDCYVRVLALLLEKGGDPNTRDKEGHTPLHRAALWNFMEGARLLLWKGADVSMKAADGHTPLEEAEMVAQAMAETEKRQRAEAALYDPMAGLSDEGSKFDNSEMVKLLKE